MIIILEGKKEETKESIPNIVILDLLKELRIPQKYALT